MAKVCEIAVHFLLTKNDIIVYYDKFQNLGVDTDQTTHSGEGVLDQCLTCKPFHHISH